MHESDRSGGTDFRLYSSNSLDVLVALLAEEIQRPVVGAAFLAPDTILIPQASMRRWLQKALAERHGIAANLRFLAPGEFVAEVLRANSNQHEDAATLDPTRLQWRLFAALRDPAVLAAPAFAGALRAYLSGAAAERNAWSLGAGLADAFAKYQAWRRDWLLQWDRGGGADDWQAVLWRSATRGRRHRAQAIDAFLRKFSASASGPPAGLPPRVFAFACLNVSPDVLNVMATAARATTVHFYLPSPTRKYWGDLRRLHGTPDETAEPFEVGDNPLLAAWGRAGRDFVATLFSYDIVAPREIEAYAVPDARRGLLQQIQADLLDRRAPSSTLRTIESIPTDPSLQIHACHTPLREVQVLHDRLRAMLEDDPTLAPCDIAVMAPDIDAYAPCIAAVFGGALGSARGIPYTVADGSASASSALTDLFLDLLDLPQARLTSNEVLDLLALPSVQRHFDLDDDALATLRGWIAAAGARFALDADDRTRLGAPREDAYTWRFALDRLLLGHATGADDAVGDVAPWPHLEGRSLDVLDALIRLLDRLRRVLRALADPHTGSEWQTVLNGMLDALLPSSPDGRDDQRALDRVRIEIAELGDAIDEAGYAGSIAPDIVRAHFRARLGEADARQPFLAGGVSFCRMVPMRLIPFRVIALLGLEDGAYPRREPPSALNRLVAALDEPAQRRRGDRSIRDDDRFLFLQLLTAADTALHLSYIGRDATDGSVREPSVLVSELLDVAARYHVDAVEARKRLVVQHALQPFAASPDADPRRAGFDAAWHIAARTQAAVADPLPFAPRPLGHAPARATVDYTALRSFLLNPHRALLRNRLEIRLPDDDARMAEHEPFVSPDALERSALKGRVLTALTDDIDVVETTLARRLEAEAVLAPAAAGARQLRALLRELRPLARSILRARSGAARSLPFALDLDGVTLAGTLDGIDEASLLRTKTGRPSGRDWLRWHLDARVLDALGDSRGLQAIALFAAGDCNARALPKRAPADARAALQWLMALLVEGETRALPFAPRSGWAWVEEREKANGEDAFERANAAAEEVWIGRDGSGERDDPWTRLALRGADPFADARSVTAFGELANAIVGAVRDAVVPAFADHRSGVDAR